MRRKTISVKIGKLTLGSDYPVMVQSMLNVSTMDTGGCVEQAIRIIKAGGELVRITAPGVRDAENLKNIHKALRDRGYDTPLSADIHFTPDAAMVAARYVEKVRINPGNFIDKRATFKEINYGEDEYAAGLVVLKEKFSEFLNVCRAHGTAVRIGTNHGSLSDRIMNRYGDTPAGMVEATMEYLRVCREVGFDNVVISLKSSDCRVMVNAVRMLVKAMEREKMCYPLHLGVTEAGEGEDGRIRSAVGIGTLLNEGIGDTIRVSLTEAPETEIPVARMLVDICGDPAFESGGDELKGECSRPVIVADLSSVDVIDETLSQTLGFEVGEVNDPVYGDRLKATIKAPEMIYTETLGPELTKLPQDIRVVVPIDLLDMAHVYNRNAVALYKMKELKQAEDIPANEMAFVQIEQVEELNTPLIERLKNCEKIVLVLSLGLKYHDYRKAFRLLKTAEVANQILVRVCVDLKKNDRTALAVASRIGGLFLDRLPDGLWLTATGTETMIDSMELSRNLLQSAGVRRYKAEFISCPGCGRTLFDLQGAVASVKQAFGHLNTLKIAVMGCVVNGPGEMGDADFGYVGAGNGKVNLYKGRQMMRAAVPEAEAIETLKVLIDSYS